MSEPKFTPGPWHVTRYSNYIGFSIFAELRGCIAERWYDSKQDEPYASQLVANAHLIAAAPDLLAACFGMLATWGSQDEDAIIAARDAARAAVEKAMGEAK